MPGKIDLSVMNKPAHDIIHRLAAKTQTYSLRLAANIHKPSQHTVAGHYRPASETPFEWRFTGGPICLLGIEIGGGSYIWTSARDLSIYRISEERRFGRVSAYSLLAYTNNGCLSIYQPPRGTSDGYSGIPSAEGVSWNKVIVDVDEAPLGTSAKEFIIGVSHMR